MKRVICILLLLVILTGCKASYDLEIDDIFFNESVSSSFNYKELELEEKDSLSAFEVSDINAFYKDSDDIFNKNITYDDNKVNINIDYDYTAYNFDNAPITPTTAPVPIIAPSEIAAGPIAFLSFNVDGFVVCFLTINIVLIEVIAPTTSINGKNIGHIVSETLVIMCSNCNKKLAI